MKIDIQKIRENSKIPKREHAGDCGADLYYCPKDGNKKIIYSSDSVLLETGIKIAVPHGFVAKIENKSGIAYKRSLVVGSCCIDSGYSGEVLVNLHNIGLLPQTIEPGDKIAQVVFYQIGLPIFDEVLGTNELYYRTETFSNRESGGFGSTGVK